MPIWCFLLLPPPHTTPSQFTGLGPFRITDVSVILIFSPKGLLWLLWLVRSPTSSDWVHHCARSEDLCTVLCIQPRQQPQLEDQVYDDASSFKLSENNINKISKEILPQTCRSKIVLETTFKTLNADQFATPHFCMQTWKHISKFLCMYVFSNNYI